MLRRFHAMKSVKAHPALPQSDSEPMADIVLVHLGYAIVLQKGMSTERVMTMKSILVVHILIPAFPDDRNSLI